MAAQFKSKLPKGHTEISVITYAGHEPIRSSNKGITERSACKFGYAHKVQPGTRVVIQHVLVTGHPFDGPIAQVLSEIHGQHYANGEIPVSVK